MTNWKSKGSLQDYRLVANDCIVVCFVVQHCLTCTYDILYTTIDFQTGMPRQCLLFIDAMANGRGDTPKEGVSRRSKQSSAITSRVFGCEVICGPVDFMCYVVVDQMVQGGGAIEATPYNSASSVHDMKNHLSDIINLKLHHFQVPHRFAQFRHVASGMAICQYQLFCPMDGQPDNWLPAAASLLDQNIQQSSIVFNRFAVVNGEGGLLGELIGLAKSVYSNPICQPNNH